MKKSIVISLLTVTIIFCNAACTYAATGIVTTDTLRMRKNPSVEASIVALLSIDDEVEILEEDNNWYKVRAEVDSAEVIGYVSAKYIKQNGQITPSKEPEKDNEINEETNNTEENKIMVKTVAVGVKTYITPTINSLVIDEVKEEKQIEIISEVNGWSYINAGDIKGWVRTENIVEKEALVTEQKNSSQKTGYISANSVNFREEANSSSKIISKFVKNTKVQIIEEENDWAKIEYNGKTGYVSKAYVSDKKITTTSRSTKNITKKKNATIQNVENVKTTVQTTQTKNTVASSNRKTNVTSKGKATGAEIVAYAKKYLGSKYVYGGNSPSGFDCSGFTSYVYKNFGYSLSRSSSGQGANGRAVSKSELQLGDIICFSRSSGSNKIGHVGIYIGNGKFIHAANSRKGVIISNISGDGFYFVCARRII